MINTVCPAFLTILAKGVRIYDEKEYLTFVSAHATISYTTPAKNQSAD
jgi:hypothetical protein